jgi:hypothetical protein
MESSRRIATPTNEITRRSLIDILHEDQSMQERPKHLDGLTPRILIDEFIRFS